MKTLPRVAVCGGGRGGLTIAADLSLMGAQVNLFQLPQFKSTIELLCSKGGIEITGETQSGKTGFAKLHLATTDAKAAVKGVDLIFVAAPAFGHKAFFDQFAPHLEPGQSILVCTSYWACLRFAGQLRKLGIFDKITLAEASILPYACNVTGPGAVHVHRTKQKGIKLAALPALKTDSMLELVRTVYPQHEKAPNVLWTTLANVNTPVHAPLTIPMAGLMFDRYYPGGCRFYGEATTPGARLVEAYDRERLAVAEALGVKVESESEIMFTLYGYKGKDIAEALRKSEHAEMYCDSAFHEALLEEDLRYFYCSLAQLGESLGISMRVTRGIVDLLGVMLNINYWEGATTLQDVGLAGLTPEQIIRYVTTGERA